jgi:hypothetical protein
VGRPRRPGHVPGGRAGDRQGRGLELGHLPGRWILIGYFSSIPRELDETVIVDGASYMQILVKVFLPVALPGRIAATIFAFTVS